MEQVKAIRGSVPNTIAVVGVFTDQPVELMEAISSACRLDLLQVHGTISQQHHSVFGDRLIPVVEVTTEDPLNRVREFNQSIVLLDAVHKSRDISFAEPFDWSLARRSVQTKKVILAGGLNPENVTGALEAVRPYAVDVSGGVEKSPGVKDHDKLELFIQRIRSWDSRTNADISASSADGSFLKR